MSKKDDKHFWGLASSHSVRKCVCDVYQIFDFETQIVYTRYEAYHGGGVAMIVFSELGEDAINHVREIMVSLGGTDPHAGKAEDKAKAKAKNSRKPFGPQPL